MGLKIYLFFRVPASRHTNSDEADFNDGLGYGFLTVRWSGALVGLVRFDCVRGAGAATSAGMRGNEQASYRRRKLVSLGMKEGHWRLAGWLHQ